MELKEAEKILKDDGYVISYSELEDKTINQMEDLVALANSLANAVGYFTDSEGKFVIVKLDAYGFTVENKETKTKTKIGLLTKNNKEPQISILIYDGNTLKHSIYADADNVNSKGIFKYVSRNS